jgi:hypothetical protein
MQIVQALTTGLAELTGLPCLDSQRYFCFCAEGEPCRGSANSSAVAECFVSFEVIRPIAFRVMAAAQVHNAIYKGCEHSNIGVAYPSD